MAMILAAFGSSTSMNVIKSAHLGAAVFISGFGLKLSIKDRADWRVVAIKVVTPTTLWKPFS